MWGNLPELAPPLIEGVLRQGHKMLIAGPSKAGKSYGLIELCCAIAEGREWLGWKSTKGKVLYTDQIPFNGGVFPSGLMEVSRTSDILGNVTVTNQYNFGLY